MRLPRPIRVYHYVVAAIIYLSVMTAAILSQSPPTKPFTGSELTKLRILNCYKSAYLAQQAFLSAKNDADRKLQEWNIVTEQAIKDEKLA